MSELTVDTTTLHISGEYYELEIGGMPVTPYYCSICAEQRFHGGPDDLGGICPHKHLLGVRVSNHLGKNDD